MSLNHHLEELERFSAKIWRVHSKEDPIAQLSFNEYDYLKVIQAAPELIRLTDLADEMQVTKPSATNMVKRLERKGLVERKPCPEDARSKRVGLTPLATDNLSLESKVYELMSDRLMKGLTEIEAQQLNELLKKALK